MVTRLRPQVVIMLVFLAVILNGCQTGGSSAKINPTQGVQLLAGKYATTITTDDIAKLGSLDDQSGNVGNWMISLQPDGKFNAELNGNFIAAGNYTVRDNSIQFGITELCPDCSCGGDIGRFNWALATDKLSFAKLGGSCDTMTLVLTSHPLLKGK